MSVSGSRTTCLLLALAGAAGAAAGDAVRLKNGIPYEPVQIRRVRNGVIAFQLPGGKTMTRAMSDVAGVSLSELAEFNRGESLMAEGKHEEAIRAFRGARGSARLGWQKTLIDYRLLAAEEAAGKIDQAVERWLQIADKGRGGPGTVALRPTRLAPAKSRENDRAIAILEARLGKITAKAYRRAVQELLVDLYARQGQVEKARALQLALSGQPGTRPADDGNGPEPPKAGSQSDQLRLARLSLKGKRYDEVVRIVRPRLKRFSAAELPAALHLLGLARLEQAKARRDPGQARELLVDAGLNLMRVATFFGDSEEAPSALLAAGEVNERLKNVEGARSAYAAVVERYAESDAAAEAKRRLARLKASEKTGK